MKRSRTTKTIGIVFVVLLAGATIAFAHGGWGQGNYGNMGGRGGHHMGYSQGGHMMDNPGHGHHKRGKGIREKLSEEQITQLDEARDKFRKATREARGLIEEKAVTLRNEIAKDETDLARARKLQKEISQLKADLDQKELEHRLEIKQIAPEIIQERGCGRRPGRGGQGHYRY